MKYFIFFLLGLGLHSKIQAQDPYELINLKSYDWIKAVDRLESFCELPHSNWVNIHEGEKVWELEDKFSFIITGSLDDPKCLENLRTLNQLQYAYPHVTVLFLHQSSNKYPADLNDLKKELIRYDIGVRSNFDSTGTTVCLPLQRESRVIMVSPQEKIYGSLDGWLNIDNLIDLTTEFTNRILDAYNLRPQPFFGKKPSQIYKTPLLQTPMYIEADEESNKLFVSDYMQQRVLVLSPEGQLLNVIGSGRARHSDGDFSQASFNGVRGLAFDKEKNILYIADGKNGRIKAANLNNQTVSTVLGNGNQPSEKVSIKGVNDALPYPLDLAIYNNELFISTVEGIWKMNLDSHMANQIPNSSSLNTEISVAIDQRGNMILTKANQNEILKLDSDDLNSSISIGLHPGFQNGRKADIAFNHPKGFYIEDDIMHLADQYNNNIRLVDVSKVKATTFSGDTLAGYKNGAMSDALYCLPSDVVKLDDKYFVSDLGNHAVRVIDEGAGKVSTLPISEYETLCYSYKPPIMELNDGPEITLAKNDSLVRINFVLSDSYTFDPEGVSYINITSRKQEKLAVKDEDITDGDISFAIRDDLQRPMDVTVDIFLYVYNKEIPGISYFKSTSYTFQISAAEISNEIESVLIKLE